MICSLRGAHHPTTQNQGNSGTTLPKGRVVGRSFHRGFVVIPTDLSSDPILVGW
ncbi:hypothetical protein LEP1GSC086_4335 [Leptospira weilii str. LNT 1234]|nr:hypothetical protein LEP1GSC086_4335 [Leptospira weilii str. LNT 1234]